MIIVKKRGASGNWYVYHKDLTSNYNLLLEEDDAEFAPASTGWVSSPTSTTFQLSTGSSSNANVNSSATYVAYCFVGVDSYSSIGSYYGTNTSDGTFVYTGFQPAFIMVKSASAGGSSTYSWSMFDNKRTSYNGQRSQLEANTNDAEDTGATADIDFLSNGFKPRYSPNDTNGPNTYIYIAFAEFPFKYANAR